MRIVDVKTTPVYVPMEAPLLWSMGVENGTTRTIIELVTDEGIVGIGETVGGASMAQRIQEAKPLFMDLDPFEVQTLVKRFEVFRVTSEQTARSAEMKFAAAGLEIAFWDIIGKALGKPLYKLWGGADVKEVPYAAYVFYRYKSEDGTKGGETTPQGIVDRYTELREKHGFTDIKLKNGVFHPDEEIEAVVKLRETYGDKIGHIRVDPNQVWSVETSVRVLKALEDYGISYCEDPTFNLKAMAQVAKRVTTPLATNMCVISFEQFAPAVELDAVQVIMADLFFWGGPSQVKKLAAHCETFGIGLSLHSDRELGIGTIAGAHFAATTPNLTHAADSHYPDQSDDILTESLKFENGCLKLPEGPGLGVEIDPYKLEKYHRLYLEVGDSLEFFDPRRPNWVPRVPLW